MGRPLLKEVRAQMTTPITLQAAAASDTGLARQNNEDAAYSAAGCMRSLTAWAASAGEVASAAVIESLRTYDSEVRTGGLARGLGRAVAEANRQVGHRAAEDPSRRGMGTTLTAMLWSGDHFALAHIGDSRAFGG